GPVGWGRVFLRRIRYTRLRTCTPLVCLWVLGFRIGAVSGWSVLTRCRRVRRGVGGRKCVLWQRVLRLGGGRLVVISGCRGFPHTYNIWPCCCTYRLLQLLFCSCLIE